MSTDLLSPLIMQKLAKCIPVILVPYTQIPHMSLNPPAYAKHDPNEPMYISERMRADYQADGNPLATSPLKYSPAHINNPQPLTPLQKKVDGTRFLPTFYTHTIVSPTTTFSHLH